MGFFKFFGVDVFTRWKTGWGKRYIVEISQSIEWEDQNEMGEWEPMKEWAEYDFRELMKLAEGLGYREDYSSFYANL